MNNPSLITSASSLCWKALRVLLWLVAIAAIGLGMFIWYSEYDSEKESASLISNHDKPLEEESPALTGFDKNYNDTINLDNPEQTTSTTEVEVTPKWVKEPIVGPGVAAIGSAIGNYNFKSMESLKSFNEMGSMKISGPFPTVDFSRLDNLRELNEGLQSMIRPQTIGNKSTEKVTTDEVPSIAADRNHNEEAMATSNESSTEMQTPPTETTNP